MGLLRIPDDVHVEGRITAQSMTVPDSAVKDASVASDAAIQATKVIHQHQKSYSQPNTTATTETRVIHEARGAGTVQEFRAGSIVACLTTATITVDLKKNGTTVLSAVITLNNGNTARVAVAGTVTSAAYVAGDVFEIVITATASGGTIGTGFFAQGTFREAA
jgi:hypothetical protein